MIVSKSFFIYSILRFYSFAVENADARVAFGCSYSIYERKMRADESDRKRIGQDQN